LCAAMLVAVDWIELADHETRWHSNTAHTRPLLFLGDGRLQTLFPVQCRVNVCAATANYDAGDDKRRGLDECHCLSEAGYMGDASLDRSPGAGVDLGTSQQFSISVAPPDRYASVLFQ
jgi:hypothetical protein